MNLYFVSLGCDKNLSDSEHMLAILSKDGFTLVEDEQDAEVAVVNTCCFIHDAMEESIQTLIDLGRLKTEGRLKVLLAAGCLAQRHAKDIRRELPEVDGVIGTNGFDTIAQAVHTALEGEYVSSLPSLAGLPRTDAGRLLSTGGHYGYLKIAEGCDKACTYCIIPKLRGPYRSIPLEALVEEAAQMAREGVRELVLVAQETTLYGVDLYGEKSLPKLIERLSEIEGIRWIRLLYCYPEEIDDALIEVLRTNPKVCHYLDMPIQHIDDEILRRMGRKTSARDIEEKIGRLRTEIPDIALRTTVMCGFPGESEEAHRSLLAFIKKTRFDRLGAFMYSQEEGTAAYDFEEQIDEETKQRRFDEIMSLQQEISAEAGKAQIGRRHMVFVEGRLADETGVYVGRTYRDAPEVDGYLFFESLSGIESGRFVEVTVTEAKEYDLVGVLYEPAE
ncbi:MAG: 30S ribosomal protein S12 methylthiotransferase RimO [Lachnospiraceae bacterium]|nr:30S ribosomal protein S12 methylthiotransferase RimO [Lachnospiraceae bacterium]